MRLLASQQSTEDPEQNEAKKEPIEDDVDEDEQDLQDRDLAQLLRNNQANINNNLTGMSKKKATM